MDMRRATSQVSGRAYTCGAHTSVCELCPAPAGPRVWLLLSVPTRLSWTVFIRECALVCTCASQGVLFTGPSRQAQGTSLSFSVSAGFQGVCVPRVVDLCVFVPACAPECLCVSRSLVCLPVCSHACLGESHPGIERRERKKED